MKMKTTKAPFVAIVFLFCFCSISAQEAITVAGGEADGIGGSASYSVGQVFYTYNEAGSFSISDGVQQAFEISAITGIEDLLGINLTMSVFPNPTIEELYLEIENYDNEALNYQLFGFSGILLKKSKINGSNSKIDMSSFVPSTYILSVSADNHIIKSFKIIKN